MKHFYHDLPEAPSFGAVFTEDYFKPLPPSWFIATTDVVNSTTAIAAGRYRDVTIAGTLGTIALANRLGSLDFPFFSFDSPREELATRDNDVHGPRESKR